MSEVSINSKSQTKRDTGGQEEKDLGEELISPLSYELAHFHILWCKVASSYDQQVKNSPTERRGSTAPPIRDTTVRTQSNNGQNKTSKATAHRRSVFVIKPFIPSSPEHTTPPSPPGVEATS